MERENQTVHGHSQFESHEMGKSFMPPAFQLKASNGLGQRKTEGSGTNNMPELSGAVYDTKGNPQGILGSDTGEPIVLFNKKILKEIRKGKNAAKKSETEYKLEASGWATIDYCVLPPFSHRAEMKKIMENDDTNGYQEFGGRGLIPIASETGELQHDKKCHVRSKDGTPAGPRDGAATIRLNTIHETEMENLSEKLPTGFFATDYTWHSHPGGSWKKKGGDPDSAFKPADEFDKETRKSESLSSGSTFGGPSVVTKGFDLGPSVADLQNAHDRFEATKETSASGTEEVYPMNRNFVIHKKQKKVFFYNQETPIGAGNSNGIIPLDVFWTLK